MCIVVHCIAKDEIGPSRMIEAPENESRKFTSLKEAVSKKTLNAIADMGFTDMMEIQHKSIRPLLEGKYVSHIILVVLLIARIERRVSNFCMVQQK